MSTASWPTLQRLKGKLGTGADPPKVRERCTAGDVSMSGAAEMTEEADRAEEVGSVPRLLPEPHESQLDEGALPSGCARRRARRS